MKIVLNKKFPIADNTNTFKGSTWSRLNCCWPSWSKRRTIAGPPGADSTVYGPHGADSTVADPHGADSTVAGPPGADSTVVGLPGGYSTLVGPLNVETPKFLNAIEVKQLLFVVSHASSKNIRILQNSNGVSNSSMRITYSW